MTDRVETGGIRVRTLSRSFFTILTAALFLSALSATAKQRAVRSPASSPLPVIAALADAQDAVTISNPLPTTSSVAVCFANRGSSTCQQASLAPNQTVSYPAFGASLSRTGDGIVTLSAALEARTPFLDGTLTSTFARTDGFRGFLPAPANSTLLLYAVEPTTVRANLLDPFSAEIGEAVISVRAYDVTRVPLWTIGVVGTEYQLRLQAMQGAFNAAIETTGKKTLTPMQLETAAQGTLYAPLIGTTTTILKNTSNTTTNTIRKDYLPPNTDNTDARTFQTVMVTNNTITTTPNTFGNGGMRLTGNLQADFTNQPFLAWHQLNGTNVPLASAIIRNACPSDTTISQDLDFAIGTGAYWLQNNTRLPTSGVFIIYDSTGNEVGRVATTLKPYENQVLNVSGEHVRYRLDTTTQCTESRPEVTVVALGDPPRGGYRVARPRAPDPVYELTTDLFVVDKNGTLLSTKGTTRDNRLIKLLYNTTTINDQLLGSYVYDNNNAAYQSLQTLIARIKANFNDADYIAVFGESQSALAPYLTDTDGDGYVIDILPAFADWPYDNNTTGPQNNTQGTTRIQWTLTRITDPVYTMTTTLGVWMNGQQLQTTGTTTSRELMQIITGILNPENRIGIYGYSNVNPNYQDLERMVERIRPPYDPRITTASFRSTTTSSSHSFRTRTRTGTRSTSAPPTGHVTMPPQRRPTNCKASCTSPTKSRRCNSPAVQLHNGSPTIARCVAHGSRQRPVMECGLASSRHTQSRYRLLSTLFCSRAHSVTVYKIRVNSG